MDGECVLGVSMSNLFEILLGLDTANHGGSSSAASAREWDSSRHSPQVAWLRAAHTSCERTDWCSYRGRDWGIRFGTRAAKMYISNTQQGSCHSLDVGMHITKDDGYLGVSIRM
jgi:hypothetical protein